MNIKEYLKELIENSIAETDKNFWISRLNNIKDDQIDRLIKIFEDEKIKLKELDEQFNIDMLKINKEYAKNIECPLYRYLIIILSLLIGYIIWYIISFLIFK